MDSMTTNDYCCVCEFCGSADNHWSRMYWVQGAIYLVDEPNCCEECVEYEDDESSDDESSDDE
jgi:hypothetical protein